MFVETFPRLAVRLRSMFPDAQVELQENSKGLRVLFSAFPNWELEVAAVAAQKGFSVFQTSLVLRYDCLQDIPEEDYLRLISAENLGLRVVTLLAEAEGTRRSIRIRSSFIGQKGRTRDEAESLAIDVLSQVRFARILEDRITRSMAGENFSYEMYYSQYLSKSIGRNRFINYARSIFQGSCERVFGQVTSMIREDYKYKVHSSKQLIATVNPPSSQLEIMVRIPEEIPVLTCTAPLYKSAAEPLETFRLVARLNSLVPSGHFEVSADGSLISYVIWKHLTNDLRFYSLDQMIAAVHQAERLLLTEMPARGLGKETTRESTPADAYRISA